MINIDQETGEKSGEPFITLTKLCKGKPKIVFGIFLVHDKERSIAPFILYKGAEVHVL